MKIQDDFIIFVQTHAMKKVFVLTSFCLLGLSAMAQRSYFFEGISIKTTSETCTDAKRGDNGYKYQIFRLENTTNETKTIRFHVDAYYDGNCATCMNIADYTYSFELKPKEVKVGKMTDAPKIGLKLFESDTQNRITDKLTDLQFTNVSVK